MFSKELCIRLTNSILTSFSFRRNRFLMVLRRMQNLPRRLNVNLFGE